jgi:3'(2'), 5'-bisphosphate nucleotidase
MTVNVMNSEVLDRVIAIAEEAGTVILKIYGTEFRVRGKADKSPVTEADEAAEQVILSKLEAVIPGTPIISEEAVSAGHIPNAGRRFWLVDPLDGTKEFINRNGEFTVNIALIDELRPVLGVVLAPALGRLFAGLAGYGAFTGTGAERRPIACRPVPAEGLTVVASRSHADADQLQSFLAGRSVAAFKSIGSSLKFCVVAAGEADIYPRLGRTMEWDIAAGHAILSAAGGKVVELNGAEMSYGKPDLANPHFVAMSSAASMCHQP